MFVIDRAIRILVGIAVLIVFGLIYPTWWCFLGLYPLMTGVSGVYPLREILIILEYKQDPDAKKEKNTKKTEATKQKTEKLKKSKKEIKNPKESKKFSLFSKKSKKLDLFSKKQDILSQSPVFND